MNMQYVFQTLFHLLYVQFRVSIPQSEETRAELSQIAWVPRQVNNPLPSSNTQAYLALDHLSSGKQACHGYCARYALWYPQVHSA